MTISSFLMSIGVTIKLNAHYLFVRIILVLGLRIYIKSLWHFVTLLTSNYDTRPLLLATLAALLAALAAGHVHCPIS